MKIIDKKVYKMLGFFLFKKKLYYTFEVIFKFLHLLIQSGLVILKFGYNEKISYFPKFHYKSTRLYIVIFFNEYY